MANVKAIWHYNFAPLPLHHRGHEAVGAGGGEAPPKPLALRKTEKQSYPMVS